MLVFSIPQRSTTLSETLGNVTLTEVKSGLYTVSNDTANKITVVQTQAILDTLSFTNRQTGMMKVAFRCQGREYLRYTAWSW